MCQKLVGGEVDHGNPASNLRHVSSPPAVHITRMEEKPPAHSSFMADDICRSGHSGCGPTLARCCTFYREKGDVQGSRELCKLSSAVANIARDVLEQIRQRDQHVWSVHYVARAVVCHLRCNT
jgi:hypothetical protein